MGTKKGEGQKIDCIVCGSVFTKQGGRKTCSKECSLLYKAQKDEFFVLKAQEKLKSRQRDDNGRRLTDNIYVNDGYVIMTGPTARNHPAATKQGWVRVHVMAAYDKYGPGPHKCHWCQKPLDWFFRQRGGTSEIGKIVVDHLNWVKIDCRTDNLVLSCNTCNKNRTIGGIPTRTRLKLLGQLKPVSEETRKKLSEAAKQRTGKGVPQTPEHRAKISAALKKRKEDSPTGYSHSEETRRKMSESAKKRYQREK